MTWARATEKEHRARNDARKAANLSLLCKPVKEQRGSYGGTTGQPVPKTEPKRNRALLDLARGESCLLRVPGVCDCIAVGDRRSTVACHSNLGIHGKAKGRKADDQYSVFGCAACHFWLDRGPALAAEKERIFMAAHLRQVEIWREMAWNPFGTNRDTPKQRKAAQWALDQLGATPAGAVA
jgi:hypothetical protein